jgi:Lon protease-like protein
MNNQAEIIDEVLTELARARSKFPTWPDDPIHAAAVVAEESGELVQAALQACYEQKRDELSFQAQLSKVRREAIQTAAMAIRFLVSMDQYMFEAGRQHKQVGEDTAVRVRCAACGDDRTGKGSLIYKGMVFCNDPCFINWKKSVLEETQNP